MAYTAGSPEFRRAARRGARPGLGRGRRRPRAVRLGDRPARGRLDPADRRGARESQRETEVRRRVASGTSTNPRVAARARVRRPEGRRAGVADPGRGRARHRDHRRRRGRVRRRARPGWSGPLVLTPGYDGPRVGGARDHGRGSAASGHRRQHVVAGQAVRSPRALAGRRPALRRRGRRDRRDRRGAARVRGGGAARPRARRRMLRPPRFVRGRRSRRPASPWCRSPTAAGSSSRRSTTCSIASRCSCRRDR